jgi:hypothetical protein
MCVRGLLTVEIHEDTAVGDAAGGAFEVSHAVRQLLHRGGFLSRCVGEVAGVDDGVAEAEDALVAAAQPHGRVEQEDDGDEKDGNPHLNTTLLRALQGRGELAKKEDDEFLDSNSFLRAFVPFYSRVVEQIWYDIAVYIARLWEFDRLRL